MPQFKIRYLAPGTPRTPTEVVVEADQVGFSGDTWTFNNAGAAIAQVAPPNRLQSLAVVETTDLDGAGSGAGGRS